MEPALPPRDAFNFTISTVLLAGSVRVNLFHVELEN